MKTLINKSTGEYIFIIANRFYFMKDLVESYSNDSNLEAIKKEHPKLDFTDIELVEIEVVRKIANTPVKEIQSIIAGMAEYFQQHNYREMFELFESKIVPLFKTMFPELNK